MLVFLVGLVLGLGVWIRIRVTDRVRVRGLFYGY